MALDLKQQLQAWDSKTSQYLIDIYQANRDQVDFFPILLSLMQTDASLRLAGTWLAKHHYEQKGSLSSEQIKAFFRFAQLAEHWGTRLHLLQLLPMVPFPTPLLLELEDFCYASLEDKKPFVRAWAYQGLFEVSKLKPEIRESLKHRCEQALAEEKASVKVRIRKVMEQLRKG